MSRVGLPEGLPVRERVRIAGPPDPEQAAALEDMAAIAWLLGRLSRATRAAQPDREP